MGGQTPSYNLRKKLEIEPYVLKPTLRELDRLLYEKVSEIGKKTRMDEANRVFTNIGIGDLGYISVTKGDISYLNNRNGHLGRTVGTCIITGNPVSPDEIICYNMNENREYKMPNPHLEDIRKTVRDVLSTLYWEIEKDLGKELHRLGYTPSEIKRAEPFEFSRLYANIRLDQQPVDPQIEIIANDNDRGTIRYEDGRSKLTLHYLFYTLL
jgi:hypothetical protein